MIKEIIKPIYNDAEEYQKLDFIIFKKITITDSKLIKDYNHKGLNFYVLLCTNSSKNFRFNYITTKEFELNQQINGYSLLFPKHEEDSSIDFEIIKNDFGEKYLHFKKSKKSITLNPKHIFQKKVEKDKEFYYKNINYCHTKRIAIDRELWFKKELKSRYNDTNYSKKIIKELLNKAIIDSRLEKVMKTQFFISKNNSFMYQNTHCILLTNGGTGKSSILGILGRKLDTTSNAGVFGYYSTQNNKWNTGIVEQTEKSLIIDEINELINKQTSRNDGILNTLNTPLENGEYSYGKAGGKDIKFANQFIFLANISPTFTFENFISGVANNPQTIGRRFAYLIYDDTMKFINGDTRTKDGIKFINIVSEFLTFIYNYLLIQKKYSYKLIREKKDLDKIQESYMLKLKTKIKEIEQPNTKQFFISYLGNESIGTRLRFMALKIVLFDELNNLVKMEINRDMDLSNINNKLPIIYEDLLKDIELSIDNVIKHQSNVTIVNTCDILKHREIEKNLGKRNKDLLEVLYENKSKFINNKLNYENIQNKELIKKHIYEIKKYSSYDRQNQQLNKYGITIVFNSQINDIQFIITNTFIFESNTKYFLKEDDEKLKLKSKTTKDKNDIDTIDIIDN